MRRLQSDAVHEAPVADGRQITGGTHVRSLIVATLAAGLMTFVGAFGTDDLRFLPRLGYWLILMWSGAMIGVGASTGIRHWGGLKRWRVAEGAAISTLIALPLTLVAVGTTTLFFGLHSFGLNAALVMFAAVFVVTASITAINYATAGPVAATTDMPPDASVINATPGHDASSPPRPRLIERLPLHLRSAAILALEAEDHYVRVHTSDGSELLLMRLTDAMAELDDLPGARTHRSWWVARAAVQSAIREDGRGELKLSNGVVAPISRSALTVLRRDGWFAPHPIA